MTGKTARWAASLKLNLEAWARQGVRFFNLPALAPAAHFDHHRANWQYKLAIQRRGHS
jgi:hypothetical protein